MILSSSIFKHKTACQKRGCLWVRTKYSPKKQMLRTLFWRKISESEYRQAYEKFGGSVITHPTVLRFISNNVNSIQSSYYSSTLNHSNNTVLCCWNNSIAGDFKILKKLVTPEYDFGEPEIILPMSRNSKPKLLGLRCENLSVLNKQAISNTIKIKKPRNQLAFLKSYAPGEGVSSKTKYNRKRLWNQMQAAGAYIRPIHEFSAKSLSAIYSDLFQKRHGKIPSTAEALKLYFETFSGMLHGYVLFMDHEPCAYQLILKSHSPDWISYEYINGGLDDAYEQWSPGTVLLWLNTHDAWEECQKAGKKMRYSFGRNRGTYKSMWCYPQTIYKTISF